MGLENQVCYNGGAQEIKCKQSRFPLIGANAPPPPAAGGNLKKTKSTIDNMLSFCGCTKVDLTAIARIGHLGHYRFPDPNSCK